MLTARPAFAPVSGRCPTAPTEITPGTAPTSRVSPSQNCGFSGGP